MVKLAEATGVDTRQLRNFLKVTELGSISRAADALGVAQPSLSQQVLRLEEELGFKLFRRTARGVTTTASGEILQKHARQILDIAEHALEEMRQVKDRARSHVALAMPYSISRLLALALAEAAMVQKPKIWLSLSEASSGEIRAMLQEGSLDLALLYDVEPLHDFTIKRLAREEMYLIGPPGKLAGLGTDASFPLNKLHTLPMILPAAAHGLRKAVDDSGLRLGFRLNVESEINSLEHIVGLVADGAGYSILTLTAVASELRSGRVSAARLDGVFERALCLARRPGSGITEASRNIEVLILQLLGGLIEKGRWVATPETGLT